jgi:hypothetical protein
VREIPSPVPLAERQDWLRGFMRGRWSDQDAGLLAWRAAILGALAELPDRAVVFTHFLVLNTIVGAQEQRDETLVFWPANASVTALHAIGDGGWQRYARGADALPGELSASIRAIRVAAGSGTPAPLRPPGDHPGRRTARD